MHRSLWVAQSEQVGPWGGGGGHEMNKEAEVRPGHAEGQLDPRAQPLEGGALTISFLPFSLWKYWV